MKKDDTKIAIVLILILLMAFISWASQAQTYEPDTLRIHAEDMFTQAEYQREQTKTLQIIAVAAVNLGAMLILKDKYSWPLEKQDRVTTWLFVGVIGITGVIALDYHKSRKRPVLL